MGITILYQTGLCGSAQTCTLCTDCTGPHGIRYALGHWAPGPPDIYYFLFLFSPACLSVCGTQAAH